MACMPSGADLGDDLILAARRGAVTTVRQLLDAGADVDFLDERTSALSIASENGHENVVRLLLERGAQINVKIKRGGAAIHEAAFEGHASVVRLLVESGADIDACTDTGATAIGIAEEMGHVHIVRMLLGNVAFTPSKEQLTIGVNFGTYFSSIAFNFEAASKSLECITSWPGAAEKFLPNTPTLMDYDAKKTHLLTWGYQVDPTSKSKLEGLRLLLDPEQPVPLYVPAANTKKELSKRGKDAVDVASDYIGALYKNALNYITSSYPKDFVYMHQMKFVFTIPGVCSDKAKHNLKRAAKLAGIYKITLAKELVAATFFALHHFKEALVLTIGDAFILCHISKRAIDLASFEYTKLGSSLEELTTESGIPYGTSILTLRFEAFIKGIIGDEDFLKLKKTYGYADALKTFDREVRPSFVGNSNQEWNILFSMANLQDDPTNNIRANCLRLKSEAVQQIFEPVTKAVAQLVAMQVANVRIKRLGANHPMGREVKAIFLIEDFECGMGPSLKLALQNASPDIPIMEPPDSWGAIIKGAVLSQIPLEEAVAHTTATKYFGVIPPEAIYNEHLHAGQPKFRDPYGLCYYVRKPTWFIKQGDELKPGMRIEVPCRQKLPSDFNHGNSILKQRIVECYDGLYDDPPEFGAMNAEKNLIKNPKADGFFIANVRTNCTLEIDLKNIPFHELKEFKDFIEYILVVKVRPHVLDYLIEINGKEIGSVTRDWS